MYQAFGINNIKSIAVLYTSNSIFNVIPQKCLSLYTNYDYNIFIGYYFLIENKTSLKDTECRCK